MSITIKDLAKKTGYTVATVSRALNNSPLVAETTRARIVDIANEIGYFPNEIARGLVKKSFQTIGVIVPDITNPFYPLLVKSIQETLRQNGYNIFLCNSDWDTDNEIELIKMLYAHRVSGIIMDPTGNETYNNIKKLEFNLPVVFTCNKTNNDEINFVLVDNYKGSKMATEYIIRLGHKKIAYIGCIEKAYTYDQRLKGYKDTLINNFKTCDESLIKFCKSKTESGYNTTQILIQEGNMPTAILTGNDIVALGVIECLSDYGYKVPEDISVIGFDDIEFASLKSINLTTVREPRYEIGKIASNIMLDIINNNKSTSREITVEPELVIRNTCMAI